MIEKEALTSYNAVLYSSGGGVVEGNINRLKNIKRQMYGRAGLDCSNGKSSYQLRDNNFIKDDDETNRLTVKSVNS